VKIINLTPHNINLVASDGSEVVVPPTTPPARITATPGEKLSLEGPVGFFAAPIWGAVQDLPAQEEGTILLVSLLVAAQCVGRTDVFSPGTGPADGCVRDEKGLIKAVTRLIQAPLR